MWRLLLGKKLSEPIGLFEETQQRLTEKPGKQTQVCSNVSGGKKKKIDAGLQ